MARSSGERGWRKARAVAVSRAARLSGPTAVASKSAAPSTHERARPHRLPAPAQRRARTPRSGWPRRGQARPPSTTCRRRPPGRRQPGGRGRRPRPDRRGRSGRLRPARPSPPARPEPQAGRGPASSGSPGTTRSRCSTTRIPRNRASFHDPNVSVRTPNTNRIPFGTFSVLARTMLPYERLDRSRGSVPRAARRRAASALAQTCKCDLRLWRSRRFRLGQAPSSWRSGPVSSGS